MKRRRNFKNLYYNNRFLKNYRDVPHLYWERRDSQSIPRNVEYEIRSRYNFPAYSYGWPRRRISQQYQPMSSYWPADQRRSTNVQPNDMAWTESREGYAVKRPIVMTGDEYWVGQQVYQPYRHSLG